MTDYWDRLNFTDTITISAGADGPRLTVHTDVVHRSSSPFLKAALSNGWKEAQEKNIVLHEFETSALEGYVHWMYTGVIQSEAGDTGPYRELFELYLLGDFLKDMVFCQGLADLVIDTRCSGTCHLPLQGEVFFVWEHTLPVCPLRGVIRELWLATPVSLSIKMLRLDPNSPYPMDFVLDLFHELSKHPNKTRFSSYSGKSPNGVKATCQSFFEDAAPGERR
jgi:hypothetical protein